MPLFVLSFQPNTTGEQKTKPTQNSVRELRGLGLSPDLVRQKYDRRDKIDVVKTGYTCKKKSPICASDHVPLRNAFGNGGEGEDIHVLSRGAHAGDEKGGGAFVTVF